jgi:tight adherence protein C
VTMLLPLLAFLFGSLIIGAAVFVFLPNKAAAIDRRLEELTLGRDEEEKPRFQSLVALFKRVGEKVPRSTKELGPLRLRLVQAGYRREEAITIFFGIRVMFALALFMFFSSSILARPNMTMALAGLGVGYVLPGMALARLAKRRAHKIRLALADALDLLVVSVEAGLGLDQALSRVGSELAFAYPQLSDELKLINLELRAGKPASMT